MTKGYYPYAMFNTEKEAYEEQQKLIAAGHRKCYYRYIGWVVYRKKED